MKKIINARIKDLRNHLEYLEANKDKIMVEKFGGDVSKWEENLKVKEGQLEELENCVKMFEREKNKEYNKIKRKQHEESKSWAKLHAQR